MQFDVPDPAYTGSPQARAHFRWAVRISLAFVALLWLLFLANWALDLDPEVSGIHPRQWSGLPGIVFAPLVHASFDHLLANTLPLFVLGTVMLFLYPNAMLRALPAVWLGSGVLVWLFGRESVHFGASGLVFGWAGYAFVAGILRRDRRAIAASLVVWFMYGSLIWGVVPVPSGVSWETHLAGLLIGVALALVLRHLDVPPRKRYAWEGEEVDAALADAVVTAMPAASAPAREAAEADAAPPPGRSSTGSAG
ncbi:MAG TPA: rhomboid family intramembrane serine protease [Albitalea sp.]|uniref:rhomboid family intramembrane serine protease n=1 Tax=Piscinibacter sp. TaxID=1903157 RepID=UPI002ED1773F